YARSIPTLQNLVQLPAALEPLAPERIWCCATGILNPADDDPNGKCPRSYVTGKKIDTAHPEKNREAFGTLAEVLQGAHRFDMRLVGICAGLHPELVLLDLDHAFEDNGVPKDWAFEVIGRFPQ